MSGWVREGGYTYYRSGHPQGHLDGVAVAAANRLVHMVTQVTFIKRIIRLRTFYTMGVISLVTVYTRTWISDLYDGSVLR